MKLIRVIGLGIALIGATPVLAQTGTTSSPSLTAPPPDRPIPQAPIGHRQPRASDVPQPNQAGSPNSVENPQDAISREDATLDRKIKGICRGC